MATIQILLCEESAGLPQRVTKDFFTFLEEVVEWNNNQDQELVIMLMGKRNTKSTRRLGDWLMERVLTPIHKVLK